MPVDREGPIHRAILAYLRAVMPDAIVHHGANEIGLSGAHVARQIAKAKRLGQVTGWPDLIVIPCSDIGPMFFEVKAPGGYPTRAQTDLHDRLRRLGYRVGLVRSVDDTRAMMAAWGVVTREA
jgi:hypothetical protein